MSAVVHLELQQAQKYTFGAGGGKEANQDRSEVSPCMKLYSGALGAGRKNIF